MSAFRDWVDMLVRDTGWFRLFYANQAPLAPDCLRMNQPSSWRLRWLKRRYGIRTVVNLRGESPRESWFRLEQSACARLGIQLINLRVWSRGLLTRDEILALRDVIMGLEHPVVIHCKAGADRAGYFSVLYRVWRLGHPVEEAVAELQVRYGHLAAARTGVLDHFFMTYLKDRELGEPLEDWILYKYDPAAVQATFQPKGIASWIVDRVLQRE